MLLRVESSVQVNRVAGNAFRDEVAASSTRELRCPNYRFKKTSLGRRFIDIEVVQAERVLSGIET